MLKRVFTIITISAFCLSALLLILAIFGAIAFEGFWLDIIISIASIAVGGFFGINALNIYNKNRLLSLISLSLICVSVLGIIIVSLFEIDAPIVANLIFSIALLSVLFNAIVTNVATFGRRYLALQMLIYFVLFITISMAIVAIFGVDLSDIIQLFITAIVLSVVGVVVLSVLRKKSKDVVGTINIPIDEYNTLVYKANEYDKLMAEKNNE